MRKVSRVIPYIPREFHARFCVLRDLGKQLKEEKNCPWRVKMGYKDLELAIKDIRTGKWSKVPTPSDLPPIELRNLSPQMNSTSPAPGRPGQDDRGDKRARESTDNSPVQAASKLARCAVSDIQMESDKNPLVHSLSDREKAWREALESAELVTTEAAVSPEKREDDQRRQTDKGTVTQVSGTPLKSIAKVQECPI